MCTGKSDAILLTGVKKKEQDCTISEFWEKLQAF